MGNADAIEYLRERSMICVFVPGKNWPDDEFDARSYSNWAISEALLALMDRPLDDPKSVILELLISIGMLCKSCKAVKRTGFEVAFCTIQEILGLLP